MKIMFICTGNICRSAMAEGIMKQIVKENKIEAEIYSCGIYAQKGESAAYFAIEAVKEYGVDISSHKATNIRESNIEQMDLILCATLSHKESILYYYPSLQGKVYTIKEYAKVRGEKDLDIQDPWGYDEKVYKSCALEIKECLQEIARRLKK